MPVLYSNHLRTRSRVSPSPRQSDTSSSVPSPSVQSVRAIDVSGEMVRRAQKKIERQGAENVTVTQTDLFDGCLAEGSFNAVLACNVLLYIEDRSAALARIRALLKPQGMLLLVSDCLGEGITRERMTKWFEYKTGKRPS